MSTDWKGIVGLSTTEECVKKVYELYEKGATSTQLAQALGLTDATIRNTFKRYGLKLKQHGGLYKGKGITLTEEEVRTMKQRELAKKYNCSQWTIWNLSKKFKTRGKGLKKSPE